MKKVKLFGLGVTGFIGFALFMVAAMDMYKDFKASKTEDIGSETILMAIAGFIVAAICMGFIDHILNGPEKEKTIPLEKKSSGSTRRVNEGKLLGGICLLGFAIFEFFTKYFSETFLVPYQDTNLLRNIFSSELFPVAIGIWGLVQIYGGVKPILDQSSE